MRWSILDAVSPARRAVCPLLLALTLLLGLASAACGGGSASDTGAGGSAAKAEPEDRGGTTADARDSGKGGAGWRWKGSRSECFYRHKDRCFTQLEAACRAARCDESRCKHDQSVPSVVTCAR